MSGTASASCQGGEVPGEPEKQHAGPAEAEVLDPPEESRDTTPTARAPRTTRPQKALESFEELATERGGVCSGGAEAGTSEKYSLPSLATSVLELAAAWA